MNCGTCAKWGRPPTSRSFGYCFADIRDHPIWRRADYPVPSPETGGTIWRPLKQSPLMPHDDGVGCFAYRHTRRHGHSPLDPPSEPRI